MRKNWFPITAYAQFSKSLQKIINSKIIILCTVIMEENCVASKANGICDLINVMLRFRIYAK